MMKWDNKLNAINSISQLHFCSSTWVKDILCLNTFGQLIIDWFPHEVSISTSCLSETRCCYGFHTWLLTNSPKFVKKLIDISGSCKPGFPDSLIECDMTVFIKFNTLTLFERRLSKTFFLIIELHSNRNLNCFDKLWKWKTQSEFHISCDWNFNPISFKCWFRIFHFCLLIHS